jgi:hypothetical protein
MATGPIVLGHCLLCRRELPRVYSAQVSGILLTPLCEDCRSRCLTNPERVVAEHPRLFEHPEAKETYIPDIPAVEPTSPPIQTERPTLTTQPAPYSKASGSSPQQVIVTDIHMPFGSMVGFMVKWAIASIPAMIILFIIGAIIFGIFGSLLFGVGSQAFMR